jgi:hypothetical protein
MIQVLTSTIVALACAATIGASVVAAATVDTNLEIKCGNQSGNYVSAVTGDRVKFAITLKNLSGTKAMATVTLRAEVPTIPGTLVSETRTIALKPRQTKKEWMEGRVPADKSGVLMIDATAELGGESDSDHAELTFGPSKIGGSTESWFSRAYLRMLVKGLMLALASDDPEAPTASTMSAVKLLFR